MINSTFSDNEHSIMSFSRLIKMMILFLLISCSSERDLCQEFIKDFKSDTGIELENDYNSFVAETGGANSDYYLMQCDSATFGQVVNQIEFVVSSKNEASYVNSGELGLWLPYESGYNYQVITSNDGISKNYFVRLSNMTIGIVFIEE